jgi:dolichol-phosphate mannosyltransferase
MNNISIVIPIFNEEKNIALLVNEIMSINEIDEIKEIVLVDDKSTDNTKHIITNLKNTNSVVNLFFHEKNFGQSKALYTGIKMAKSDIIITLDADLQNNPKDISKLFNIYFSDINTKLVGGIRANRKDNLIKIMSSKFANFVRKFFLNDECDDTGCSLKMFDRNVFLSFPYFNGIHRFLPALFKYSGSKNQFVFVDHRPRKYGFSKYGTLDRAFKGLKDLYKVKKIIRNLKND